MSVVRNAFTVKALTHPPPFTFSDSKEMATNFPSLEYESMLLSLYRL